MPETVKATKATLETKTTDTTTSTATHLPPGWTLVKYANNLGEGARCPGCGRVEDLVDVGGHRCNPG